MPIKQVIFISGPPGTGKTAVAAKLGGLLGSPVVDVDDIKRERYGTTAQCVPEEDFPDAGRRAREALQDSDNVIIVESFADDRHVDLVVAQLADGVSAVHFLLWCEPDIGVSRKRRSLSAAVVRAQFARFAGRSYPERTRIDTSTRAASDIVAEIASKLGGTVSA